MCIRSLTFCDDVDILFPEPLLDGSRTATYKHTPVSDVADHFPISRTGLGGSLGRRVASVRIGSEWDISN